MKRDDRPAPDIDLGELKRLRAAAEAACQYDGGLIHCHCPAHQAADDLESMAPILAARVLADAAVKRDVRTALEAARKANHRYDSEAAVDANLDTALAKLGATE